MRRLINGQNVAFDTHQAGDKQETNWRKVHLEKRLHGGKGKIRFPLFDGELISHSGMNENKFKSVIDEIKKALRKNERLLIELAQTVIDQLNRFSNGKASAEDARIAAKKFAKYFDLDAEFLRIVEEYAGNKLTSFSSIHYDFTGNKLIEIVQTKEEIAIQKPKRYNSLRRITPRY